MIKTYLVIKNNAVINSILIDDAIEFSSDADLLLDYETTPSINWSWNKDTKEWELVRTENGGGQIGFSWNGSECVTTEPMPAPFIIVQPTTTGSQTL